MASEIDNEILKRLDDWEKESSPGPIELYIRLMRLQIDSGSDISPQMPALPAEAIAERLNRHVPLLTFADMDIDWVKFEKLLREALAVISSYSDSIDPESDIPIKDAAEAWYEIKPLPQTDMDDETLAVAIHTAMKPFLKAYSRSLLPEVDQKRWRRGYCPICGSKPNFAFLSKEQEGARWLICPRCDARWLFQRLECPFCGNKEQNKLSYLTDDKGLYRVYICEECKGYLKSIDLRKAESEVILPLEWVSTLDLDRQACESGYSAGA
jgi:formate dehydrogenase maturation protein FdhE